MGKVSSGREGGADSLLSRVGSREASHPEDQDRAAVLEALHQPRFVELARTEVCAALLTEGQYLCSVRTMHPILAENEEAKEPRDVARQPKCEPPEPLADDPNHVWSWDITKLRGPAKWSCFQPYVILDIFRRNVVGWMATNPEAAVQAELLTLG